MLVRAAILLVLAIGSALSIAAMGSASTGFESAGFDAAVQQDAPVFSIQVESLTATGASCADIKPFTATEGGAPQAPMYICADANYGRPIITWRNDPNAEWYNLWFGVLGANFYQAHYQWYSAEPNTFNLPQATCEGLTCTAKPAIEILQGGEFEVWMQAWGGGQFSSGGSGASIGAPAWNGPQTFSIPTAAPGPATGMTYTVDGEGKLSLGWAESEGSTWYNVWLGTAPTEWSARSYVWIDSVSLGCHDDGICWLTPGTPTLSATGVPALQPGAFNVTLSPDEYIFYVQSWGHGKFSTGGIEGTSWVPSDNFTIE